MQINITLNLSEEVLNQYNALGKNLSDTLSKRLTRCVDYTSQKPLYINDSVRAKLDMLLGQNLTDAEHLLRLVERLATLKVGPAELTLQPNLLDRLKSRCFGMKFEDFVKSQVLRDLETFTGLR